MPSIHRNTQTAPRANIFRRDQSTAHDLASFKHLMRYNDWRHDPLSQGSPFASICGRGDLAPEGADFGPVLKGCYDSKVGGRLGWGARGGVCWRAVHA